MTNWAGWKKVEEDVEVPTVFIMNMDIAKSKGLASATHPVEHQKKINAFQLELQNILSSVFFCNDKWTGDGLVSLYKHPGAEADDLIKKALDIISLLQDWNFKKKFAKPVGLRIGIAVGTIIFQKRIGGIVNDVMNKAGFFQKSCPGTGGILMTDGVHRFIKDQELKNKFKPSLFMIGQEIRSVYYYPQDSGEKIPPLITSTGITKLIDLSKLFDDKAKFSDLDNYLKNIVNQAKNAKEVILTGRGPIWLYLHATLKLKDKRRLLYDDGKGHLFEIFDYTLV